MKTVEFYRITFYYNVSWSYGIDIGWSSFIMTSIFESTNLFSTAAQLHNYVYQCFSLSTVQLFVCGCLFAYNALSHKSGNGPMEVTKCTTKL